MIINVIKGILMGFGLLYLTIGAVWVGLSIFDTVRIKYNMVNMTIVADKMVDSNLDDNLEKINKNACKVFVKDETGPTSILCFFQNKETKGQ